MGKGSRDLLVAYQTMIEGAFGQQAGSAVVGRYDHAAEFGAAEIHLSLESRSQL